jgi:protein TonB
MAEGLHSRAQGHRLRNHLSGVTIMLLGTLLVLSTVVLINRFSDGPDEEPAQDPTSFQVETPEPPPQEKVEKEPEPKQQEPKNPPPSPLEGLGSSLSGGFEMGGLDIDTRDMGGMSDEVLGDTRDVVMTGESVDVPPKPRRRAEMQYPPQARQQGITGYVTVNLLIDAQGRVQRVKVLDAEPAGVFEEVAKQALRKWRFEPAQYQDEAVKVWAKQQIQFDLS